jgi:hypothetical protein
MLVKGQLRGDAKKLADHLVRTDTNENVEIISGNMTGTIHEVMETMKLMHGSDKRNVLHAKIAVEPNRAKILTKADWKKIIKEYIAFYKLENHGYIAVQHMKNGHAHMHLVFTARDFDKKLFNDYKIFKRNITCQIAICNKLKDLDLKPAQIGVDQFGNKMPRRKKTDADFRKEVDRPSPKGLSADDVILRINSIWQKTAQFHDTAQRGAMFQNGLQRFGFALVEGQRGPGIINLAEPNSFHLLSRRLGIKTAEARKLVIGLKLPSLDEAKQRNVSKLITTQHETTTQTWFQAEARIERLQKIEAFSRQRRMEARRQQRLHRLHNAELSKLDSAYGSPNNEEMQAVSLHRHLKSMGLEKSGIWKSSVDQSWRFHVSATRETICIHSDRIVIHGRSNPQMTSEQAIQAMIETAKAKGWKTMTFFGSSDFRKRAAIEADRNGIKLHDSDLKKYVEERNARIQAKHDKEFKAMKGIVPFPIPSHIKASLEKTMLPKAIKKAAPPIEEVYQGPKFR